MRGVTMLARKTSSWGAFGCFVSGPTITARNGCGCDGGRAGGTTTDYLPNLRRCTRVLRRSLRCFFFDIRLRRFLMTEPMRRPFLIVARPGGRKLR